MIQALRQRHSRLAGYLAVLWFMLFVACALVHVGGHVHLDQQLGGESVSTLDHTAAAQLLSTHHHDLADSTALDNSCSALQNTPLSQLLLMLALVVLIALPGLFTLPVRLARHLLHLAPFTYPGVPPPLRLQLQRFNE